MSSCLYIRGKRSPIHRKRCWCCCYQCIAAATKAARIWRALVQHEHFNWSLSQGSDDLQPDKQQPLHFAVPPQPSIHSFPAVLVVTINITFPSGDHITNNWINSPFYYLRCPLFALIHPEQVNRKWRLHSSCSCLRHRAPICQSFTFLGLAHIILSE